MKPRKDAGNPVAGEQQPRIMIPQRQPRQAAMDYEQSLSVAERRQTGTVYTPAHLVELILDLAGYTPDGALESRTLLDPACGCGVFLEHAVLRLAERWRGLQASPGTGSDVRSFLEMVESTLFGLDLDDRAAALATELVRHSVGEVVGSENVPEGFFATNIRQGDFLEAGWTQLDLFEPKPAQRFHFIVGNPPYVTTTRLSAREKSSLRGRFVTAHGRIDLYSLFFERALQIVEEDGIVAFITPDKFLTSESAVPLRKLLASRGMIRSVARFRSHRVFHRAATVPCVTVIQKSRAHGPVGYLECRDVQAEKSKDRRIAIEKNIRLSPPPARGEAWHFFDPKIGDIAASLKGEHPTLQQISRRISAGIATGRDQIFVVPHKVAEDLEPDLLHPAVRGQDLRAFEIARPDSWVIIPYVHDGEGPPRLVELKEYARIRSYLHTHRRELEARHCVRRWGNPWFDIHDPWTLNVTAEPKILFPDIANSNRFAFDPGKLCPLHSAYYILPKDVDPQYLTALLNSSPLEFLIRLHAPLVKDGFSRYRKQFLKTLPVPILGARERRAIVNVAQESIALLNERVARVFGLSPRDAQLVDDFVAQARGSRAARSSGPKAA